MKGTIVMPCPSPSVPLLLDIDGILATGGPPFDDRRGVTGEPRPQAHEHVAARILVVEDDWFAGTDIQGALQDAGYDVLELVTSAEEAVAAAGKDRPDLVIMDVRLVGKRDGVEAALEIARRFGIRSLFVTAYVDPGLKSRAAAARPLGWLTKPITGEALVNAVKEALGRQ